LLPLLLVMPAAAVPSPAGAATLLPLLPVADLAVGDQRVALNEGHGGQGPACWHLLWDAGLPPLLLLLLLLLPPLLLLLLLAPLLLLVVV
jgi:hypothetical protein